MNHGRELWKCDRARPLSHCSTNTLKIQCDFKSSLDRDKTKRQFLASGYMHLPGKKIVSVTASHDELTPLAQMLAQSLFRQAKKSF